MMVEPLSDENRETLMEFARGRLPASLFVLYDVLEEPQNTEAWIATELGRVEGVSLRYRKRSLVMLGSRRAANSLAAELSHLGDTSITCDPECLPSVRRWFQLAGVPRRMHNMVVEEGHEILSKRHLVKELGVEDADEFISLTQAVDRSIDTRAEFDESLSKGNTLYAGIRVGDRLVSAGRCLILRGTGGIILSASTDDPFRNRGYGTSLVSYLTERVLEEGRLSTLFVEEDNGPAIHLYEKTGYTKGATVFMCRASGVNRLRRESLAESEPKTGSLFPYAALGRGSSWTTLDAVEEERSDLPPRSPLSRYSSRAEFLHLGGRSSGSCTMTWISWPMDPPPDGPFKLRNQAGPVPREVWKSEVSGAYADDSVLIEEAICQRGK